MTETSPSKSHEGDLCWNCAHLGGCLHASGRVKRCGKFELWEEPGGKLLTRAQAAEILGLGICTVIKYSHLYPKLLLSRLHAKGLQAELRLMWYRGGKPVYQIYVIGREKV